MCCFTIDHSHEIGKSPKFQTDRTPSRGGGLWLVNWLSCLCTIDTGIEGPADRLGQII
jgi:hypothetical protein